METELLSLGYYSLSEIEGWPSNPKTHDVEFLIKSIRDHGFNDPVARDADTGKLVEGHGRVKALRAMQERGDISPENVRVDSGSWLVPVLTLDFEDESALEAYMIAHNKSEERGGWDEEMLAEVLARQESERGSTESTGFDPENARELIDEHVPDSEPTDYKDEIDLPDPSPPPDPDVEAEHKIVIHCEEEDRNDFSETLTEWNERPSVEVHIS